MKENKVMRGEKNSFFTGKGFYITLAVSIIAVGAAAWIGVSSSITKLDNGNEEVLNTPLPSQAVEKKEWDVPAVEDLPTSSTSSSSSTPIKPVAQGYIMPLTGDILNAFSGDNVVKSKTLDEWIMHTGIDIKAEVGTPVKAVSGGTVLSVGNDPLWGATVVIEHADGTTSHYANLKSAINVKSGQAVKLGDVIGSVGATAEIEQKEGSHLHFAVKRGDNWIDPMSIIK